MFLIFGLDELKKEGLDATIIVDKDTVWTYSERSWIRQTSFNEYNWKKYDVYMNNEKLEIIIYGIVINGMLLMIKRMLLC